MRDHQQKRPEDGTVFAAVESFFVTLILVASSLAPVRLMAATDTRTGAFLVNIESQSIHPHRSDSHLQYAFSRAEQYYVYVPAAYTGSESYGLIVFTDSQSGTVRLPLMWKPVLDAHKYIFIAAQNAGNEPRGRRLGLAVMGALKIMSRYRIDPSRVYAAGFSGGARMSGLLGFYQSDIFRGTIQICGADFYERVPIVAATSQLDTAGRPYGMFDATKQEISNARAVRFVLITGSNDFRRGNILDVFHGGFERAKFQAKLFDVPGMDHTICDSGVLSWALDFLETA
jgi:Esterase PHB depolymerase